MTPLKQMSPFAGYSTEDHPLASYAVLTTIFNAAFAGALVAAKRADRLPRRTTLGEVVLLAAATQKLSRLIAKDKVTSALRAPFTEYQDSGDAPGEVEEKPRGTGMRLALGELLVCPYCLAQWVAAGFVTGSALAPRGTRFVAAVFATLGVSDVLQLAYKAAEERA